MKKRIVSLFFIVMTITLLIAGCGKSKETKSSSSNKISGEVTFWTVGDKSNENDLTYPWLQENIKEFEKKYPDCKVKPTFVSNGEDYLTKITTEVAAGNAPDVFRTYLSGRLQPFVQGQKVLPLEDMFKKYPETNSIMNKKGLNLSTFDGKTYAIPLTSSGEMVYYNKKIFKENGVEIPKTYDDLLKSIDVFKKNGVTPCLMGLSDPWPGSIPYMMIFNRLNGNDLYKKVVLDKKADFDNPAFAKAGEYLQELVKRGMFNDTMTAVSSEECSNDFKEGKSAMIITGTWDNPLYGKEMGDNVGFFNFPKIEGGKGNTHDKIMNYDEGYAIGSNTKNKAAAEAFLAFMFSKERQSAYVELGGLIAAKNVDYDESKLTNLNKETMKAFDSASYSVIPWDNPLGTDVGAEFNNTTLSIITGTDPQKAFNKLQDYASEAWDE